MDNAAHRRVQEAARDARSNDDLVGDDFEAMMAEPRHPLDEDTLDEQHSTQMGEMWESTRRDAE